MLDSKICRKCGKTKPLAAYYSRKNSKDGKYNICILCAREDTKGWKETLAPAQKHLYARASVLKQYNLTLEDYDEMVKRQNGLCAICRQPPVRDKHLSVDHNRRCCPTNASCGKCTRDLLCIKCNTAIAMLNENLDTIMAAHNYILEHKLSEYLSNN